MTEYRLVTIPVSHYCEKARWALDRLGLAYTEDGHLPFGHFRATLGLSPKRSVPVLVRGHEVWPDSTDILQHLDTRAPVGLRLYPEAAALRKEVETLEDLFDEKLGPAVRRWAYFHLLPHRTLAERVVGTGAPAIERRAMRLLFPLARQVLRRALNITPETAEKSRVRMVALFDEVSARLQDGRRFLVGDRFTAADLTFASLAAVALLPPEAPVLRMDLTDLPASMRPDVERLRATPAGQFALRMYAEQRKP